MRKAQRIPRRQLQQKNATISDTDNWRPLSDNGSIPVSREDFRCKL